MGRELKPFEDALAKAAEDFAATAETLEWQSEKIFAMQQLTKTDFAMQVANRNPLSVRLAMLNLAATGLTLNPAYGYAFLVPRDGSIVLELSYKGLLRVATDTGSILWGRADCVYDAEEFVYHGPAKAPEHVANPFKRDGREIIGVYCIAKTKDGDILCDVMTREQIEAVRAKSDLWAKKKSGPWLEFFSEQCKKAVIKRAQKTWPHSDRTDKLLRAIELANESEGGYTLDRPPLELVTAEQAATLRDWLSETGISEPSFCDLYTIEKLDALPRMRFNEALATLKQKRIATDAGN